MISFVLLLVLSLSGLANCYSQENFKTCHQSSFCSRQRAYEPGKQVNMGPYKEGNGDMIMEYSAYHLADGEWNFNTKAKGYITGKLVRTFKRFRGNVTVPEEEGKEYLKLQIDRYRKIGWRVRIDDSSENRWREVADDVLLSMNLEGVPLLVENSKGATLLSASGDDKDLEDSTVLILHAPFEIIVYNQQKHQPIMQVNPSGRLNVEREYLKGGHLDDKFKSWSDKVKNGRMSIGLDISFTSSLGLYGIPEHATDFALKTTDGTQYSEPYRLYNLDVFEYDLDKSVALYGAVPMLFSHSSSISSGMLWVNPSETWIDVSNADANPDFTRLRGFFPSINPIANSASDAGKTAHFISETGILDVFLYPGPRPAQVSSQFARTVGTPALPPVFALGYHQCRWNYKDEEDVSFVDKEMDASGFPFDVLWLDIEHTDGKKYFTWDQKLFPNPQKMIGNMKEKYRRMVTIVDPHIKEDDQYYVFKQAKDQGLAVMSESLVPFVGHCWPGSSVWIDYTKESARLWWSELFSLSKYKGSTDSLFIWNDMNEPSVFNGPEITMPKDNIHSSNREHRDVHNIYGMYQHRSTAEGLVKRNPGDRPFVLSRSFFIGTQRYGAVWTGDNMATWSHLEASVPMLLALNIAGIMFSGADVGGFFGNPDAELLTRWYQLAVYQPFFRGHAHIETKRREPYLLQDPFASAVRTSIRERGRILPYIYTTFYESHTTGAPIMRPFFFEFPEHLDTSFGYMFGSRFAVFPITMASQTTMKINLPVGALWYNWQDWSKGSISGGQHTLKISDNIEDSIPVYVRSGSIVPIYGNPRRTVQANYNFDNISIVVFPQIEGKISMAEGTLFFDDGQTFGYLDGSYSYSLMKLTGGKATNGALKYTITNSLLEVDEDARGRYAKSVNYQSAYPYSAVSSKSAPKPPKRIDRISVVLPGNEGIAAKIKSVNVIANTAKVPKETVNDKVIFWTVPGSKDTILEIKWPNVSLSEPWVITIQ